MDRENIAGRIMPKDERFFPENLKYNTVCDEYFCVDIETTGLDPSEDDGIIELYWQHIKDWEVVESRHALFWHPKYERTQHIHQISYDEIKDKPMFDLNDKDAMNELAIISYFLERCCNSDDNIALMAQYAPFEVKWLSNKMDIDIRDSIKVYDTRSAEKMLFPDLSASLIPMCDRRDIKSPNGKDFHRAQWDVEAMCKVANQQHKEIVYLGVKPNIPFRCLL